MKLSSLTFKEMEELFESVETNFRQWNGKYTIGENTFGGIGKAKKGIWACVHISEISCKGEEDLFSKSKVRCFVRKEGEKFFNEVHPHLPGKCKHLDYRKW